MRTTKLLYLSIFAATLFAQSPNPTVAILDFEGQGVSASEVQTLTERLRTEIGNTNAVRLIERKAVEKIMAEQGFQQSAPLSPKCNLLSKIHHVSALHKGPLRYFGTPKAHRAYTNLRIAILLRPTACDLRAL